MANVTVQDVKRADPVHGPYCAKGMKIFCALHGLDFGAFVRGGIPEERLLETGDHYAVKAVAEARRREELERGQQ